MRQPASHNPPENPGVMSLIQAIIRNDAAEASKLLELSASLARERLTVGATRKTATDFYFPAIRHYLVTGDTPMHAAAAGYRKHIADVLIKKGADVSAANRRGAHPLHYAADGGPVVCSWDPRAQAEIITFLIENGADPNALDKSGVAPLHRAVRQRCSLAVDSLLEGGAAVRLKNKSGSTPLHLAVQNTGKGGTGSPEARGLQKEIIQRLLKAGANPLDRDGRGKTVRQCAQSDWIRSLL